MSEENREGSWDDERGEERSDEWKVVSYKGRRYNAFAVASLQPSLVASLLVQSHLSFLRSPLSYQTTNWYSSSVASLTFAAPSAM